MMEIWRRKESVMPRTKADEKKIISTMQWVQKGQETENVERQNNCCRNIYHTGGE